MAVLGASLYLVHLAGSSYLPSAGEAYGAMIDDINAASPPKGSDMWDGAKSAVVEILNTSRDNVEHAGDVLRLLAYELAEGDTQASDELKDKANLDSLPELTSDGWSDEEGN